MGEPVPRGRGRPRVAHLLVLLRAIRLEPDHAGWRELHGYLEHVAREWDLPGRALLKTKVESVRWSEDAESYTIETDNGETYGPFRAVISAVGFLNTPLVPPFARGETPFAGDICHTSTWRDELCLDGKNVGVLGTGSSAVQVVTEAERQGKSVKVFQIEPNWLLPKNARDFTPLERRLNRIPAVHAFRRLKLYLGYDLRQVRTSHARRTGRYNKSRHAAAQSYLHESMKSRPEMIDLLTPTFPIEARRTVVSDTYYQSLLSPKVTLVPHAVTSLTPRGVVDAQGVEHELDLIVLATGFDAANYLSTFKVYGEGGVELHDQWAGEAEAMLGLMVPNFPNFFMMFGPNTNGIPLVTLYEAQARFAAKVTKKLVEGGARRVRVRRRVYERFNRRLQSQLAKTVWGETTSYFQAHSGKIISQWPFSASAFLFWTRALRHLGVASD